VKDDAPHVLVADDQPDVLAALRLLLRSEGFDTQTAASPAEVLELLEVDDFDVLLLDLNYTRDTTSGQEGLDLLPKIQALDGTLPVIVMTAWGSIASAVEAMRLELGRAVRKAQLLEAENEMLRADDVPELIADSRAMQPVLRLIERVGPSDANVLITGEPGTGKEVVARWLHARSNRGYRPLVTVNTGGLYRLHCPGVGDQLRHVVGPEHLVLGLQQLGLPDGPPELQRVGSSKTRKVDVRVLTATNTDLERAVADSLFREDLYYRLNTVEIRIPPLRDRREDISVLAAHFLLISGTKYGRPELKFSAAAMDSLLRHPWPGNVRELRHCVERAVLMVENNTVDVEHLGLRQAAEGSLRLEGVPLDEAERILIRKALSRNRGNVSRAADDLGLSRSALYRRLKRHGLHV
jgi:DNA-binding NtrC family response regulator